MCLFHPLVSSHLQQQFMISVVGVICVRMSGDGRVLWCGSACGQVSLQLLDMQKLSGNHQFHKDRKHQQGISTFYS